MPLQPASPSPLIWILPIPQDTAQRAPPPGSLPPSSAYFTLTSSLSPFPAPPPSAGPRPTTQENELPEARKHAPQFIFLPTTPALFLTQVGVQTIPDDQAQLCSKPQTSPFPGVGHPQEQAVLSPGRAQPRPTSLERCHHSEGKAAQASGRHFWCLSLLDEGQAFSQFNPHDL